ncbi:nitrite reductase large subunit [Halomonas sp. MCCC 1A17488]|uniref:nitrite reductase large subunit NirB n=1 Tax=unclassified Halomonas TaxID=2609666 RepID=UPI0018D204C3|nr:MULTISPECIES: nitrite reductase large subunit NirB [unclassified Halomonas]MCE8016114.1 nitrite reductase large subunit [Halomonas sp. MCCC 1A17488]MCG3239447.1 nitrite reductase large subunit [Halomonas sp. MCCC 1A17488]QPP50627.1 nitrite reductase large subunit [Halomonas sp. SS10-MC5]
MNTPAKPQLIVIGNGMVGHHLVEQLVEQGATERYAVTVFGEERHLAYDRVHLSEYFSGRDAASLALSTSEYYAEHGIELRLHEAVTAIDRDKGEVVTPQGRYRYDRLVLATGSYPFVPPIPGNDREGCLVYRTLEDLDAIRAAAETATTGVVVGGGLLGLEAANALRGLNLDTAVVEFAPRLMPMQVDSEGGELLREKIEALGVQVLTGRATQEIVDGEASRHRMVFQDDKVLETDLIVFSAGIRPRDELARDCGLEIGERGGVVIDDNCLTSDPAILAVGEVALWNNSIFGLVAPGYQMAKVAASTLLEGGETFRGADMSTKLKLMGVDVGSIGDAHGDRTPGARQFRFLDPLKQQYRKLVVSSDGKRVVGAMLVGDNSYYDTLLQYYANRIELPEDPAALILPAGGEAAPALGPDALPETATICSCHNVTKGDVCASIDAGAVDLGAVKGATKASTGCGGCAALLKNLVDHELESRGVEVDKSICEHFPHTRQELYDIVRVEGIKTFSELVNKHGHGLGCDICKPAVASILASCFNEPITDAAHIPLQDTNDTFMANMQKNGTYSVVPRVPGGEITPDKLVVLGQVAQKYQLYTKVTGGQRIDLFGARLEDLPAIWGELIEAGFETGHAYGKSLRTVKSCVGSTWCRYGVQDSVGMAIQLEHRYKGLRAPHKLKFGVSGCTRECAEAQSKDIGVIATENGWNLYVCGNGGMRPRHAELFATDLDDEQLYRIIDRFLMFYIRTADRLQRTSVWRENLEGGLDYLKQVILEDSLGIGEELERQMQAVVDTYECEWANAIGDPEKLKRFRSFVNDARPDPDIIYTTERGQLRPA